MNPTVPTNIPDGSTSLYLKIAIAVAAVIAAVTSVLDGNYVVETVAAGLAAGSFLITLAVGKYAQAVALIRSATPDKVDADVTLR